MIRSARNVAAAIAIAAALPCTAAPRALAGAASGAVPNPILRNDAGHFPAGQVQRTAPIVVRVSGGFDWAAAGVGAAAALALGLGAAGAGSVVRRGRSRPRVAQGA